MSSTQMDVSLIVINRKQDIASWLEGDIDQLIVRDKNRYQKRKSAVIEYFQSDAPAAEISMRYRLAKSDKLEELARQCCALHEDGQPWGFRALVPGVKVVDANASTSAQSSQPVESARSDEKGAASSSRATLFALDDEMVAQAPVLAEDAVFDNEDTSKRETVILAKFADLPQTPVPTEAGERAASTISAADQLVKPVETGADTQDESEVEQEEFPVALNGIVEMSAEAEEEVEQEEFPVAFNGIAEMPAEAEEEVEQEEFPVAFNGIAEMPAEAEEEVEQEEFPAVPDMSLAAIADVAVIQSGETVTTSPDDVSLSQVSTLASEDEDEENGEPTGKHPVIKLATSDRPGGTDGLTATTTLILENENENKTEKEIKVDKAEEAASEVDQVHDEQQEAVVVERAEAEITELDTVEVARVRTEDRLNRVAATETIKVPATMLDLLEKADQELQERAEATVVPEAEVADLPTVVPAKETASRPSVEVAATAAIFEDTVVSDDVTELPTQTLEVWRRDSRQLTQAPSLKSPTQSLAEDSRYRITGSQVAIKHAVRRRWNKQDRQQKYRRWTRIISAAVVVSILVILLIPLGVGLVGYNAYTNIKNVANDGVSNLLSLKELIPANKNDIMSALNAQKLANAKDNLQKAQSDFLQLQDMVNRPDIESLLQQFAPQYSSKLDMARRLVQVALDVSRMGQELIGVAQMGAGVLHGSGSLLSSSSSTPLFSANDVNAIEAALVHAQYYIGDIQTQMSQVNLASIPFGNATQKAELAKYLGQIPQAESTIAQVQTLVGPVSWLLGIGQTRHILVQTLDRGELRPSGGFEGQYGLLTLQNGRMSPFSLRDITLLDYAENGAELGATPPPQYSWMNFGNFGVRDANLSADFPTTAQIVMHYFEAEGGGPVDGDIQITPVVIEQFLQLTGPIKIAEYNETITAQNLENKLHEYQQDPRLISKQQQITGKDTKATRKAFTNLVGTMLMARIKKLSPTEMLAFGKILLKDLKTRDLQIYLNNPVAEQWLTQNGDSGAMPRFTNGNDGFMVVQSNISISKAAQYVKSTYTDNVTLDANGGATHHLTITLNYQQTGPVYGFNTYADYMRIYAPANAQLISAYGFNTGSVLCTPGKFTTTTTKNGKTTTTSSGGGAYTDAGIAISGCGQYYHTFTDTNARYCPDGNYELGYDGMMARPWPVQNLGAPSATHSDLPGYAMWGGLTLTPMNCISKITLSWYVPHIIQHTAGQPPYQMIVGHQAGWPDTAQISIDASALKGVKSLNYNQVIDVDTLVALASLPLPPSQQKPTTPTPAITPTATPKKP